MAGPAQAETRNAAAIVNVDIFTINTPADTILSGYTKIEHLAINLRMI